MNNGSFTGVVIIVKHHVRVPLAKIIIKLSDLQNSRQTSVFLTLADSIIDSLSKNEI